MSRVFLVGPLAWEPLTQTVLGVNLQHVDKVRMRNVKLGPASAFPFPHIEEGHVTEGVALSIETPEAFDALNYFAAALGAHPVPKHAFIDGKRCSGILFVADDFTDTAPLDLETWTTDWSDIALGAAAEIMGYQGRIPAADLGWRMPMILSRALAEHAAKANPAPAQLRRSTERAEVQVHARQATHEGFFLTRSYDLQHPQFDGSQSALLHREVFVAADAVIALPYDPARDRVLLVEQFRMGPFGRGDPYPWVLEPVAGRIDAGETTEDAARRECEEEAGLSLTHIEHVSSHYFSPGASTEYYHCFLALADLPDGVAGSGGLDSEHEDIKTHVLSFDAAMELLTTGEANIGPMILLMLWLERERPRLRSLA